MPKGVRLVLDVANPKCQKALHAKERHHNQERGPWAEPVQESPCPAHLEEVPLSYLHATEPTTATTTPPSPASVEAAPDLRELLLAAQSLHRDIVDPRSNTESGFHIMKNQMNDITSRITALKHVRELEGMSSAVDNSE